MTTAQRIALAVAFERLQARIAAQPVSLTSYCRTVGKTTGQHEPLRSRRGATSPLKVATKIRGPYRRRTANIAE